MSENSIHENRRRTIKTYFEKIDAGTFDQNYYNLYSVNAELFHPKFEYPRGKNGMKCFGNVMSVYLELLKHNLDNFLHTGCGSTILVEGNGEYHF